MLLFSCSDSYVKLTPNPNAKLFCKMSNYDKQYHFYPKSIIPFSISSSNIDSNVTYGHVLAPFIKHFKSCYVVIKSVTFFDDFFSVLVYKASEWSQAEDVIYESLSMIEEYNILIERLEEYDSISLHSVANDEKDEIKKVINRVSNQFAVPHGGNIKFIGVSKENIFIEIQGSCIECSFLNLILDRLSESLSVFSRSLITI